MEVYDDGLDETMKYYESGADMPFNFKLIRGLPSTHCNVQIYHDCIKEWMDKMPAGKWPCFVVNTYYSLKHIPPEFR